MGKSSLCRSKGIVVGLLVGGPSWIIRPDYAIHCFSHTNCDDQDDYDGGEEDYDDGDFKSCTSQNLTEIFKSSGGKK